MMGIIREFVAWLHVVVWTIRQRRHEADLRQYRQIWIDAGIVRDEPECNARLIYGRCPNGPYHDHMLVGGKIVCLTANPCVLGERQPIDMPDSHRTR